MFFYVFRGADFKNDIKNFVMSMILPLPGASTWCIGFQPFLYGCTLFSYSNFRGTLITLVNNKKVFTENLSMISQFSSQNHCEL